MLKPHSVVVVGAGTMGAGIAQWFSQQLIPTTICDLNPLMCEKALEGIHQSWDKLVEKEKLSACQASQMKSLLDTKPLSAVSDKTALVVEAIIEDLKIKKDFFTSIDQKFSHETIFASNTSSFPIAWLAESVGASRRKKMLGLHFFNPATLMKLVEVIQSPETSPEIAKGLYDFFETRGKEPALCRDTPGFIVNRVARSFYGEALRIVDTENSQKIQEVDQIFKEVGGFKMGPFELMDLIGVDVNLSVTKAVWEALHHSPRFAPHRLQQKLVDEGRFGKKTKNGFYRYE